MKPGWMHGRFDYPRRPPPWWPEGGQWPPVRRWRHRPGGWVWRVAGFLVFAVLAPLVFCVGTLWLLGLLGQPRAEISAVAWIALLAVLGGLLLVLVTGLRRLALPLGDLIEAAGRVEDGDYSVRVEARGPRELRLLGRAFNDMAGRLEQTEQLRRELVADLSHELRNPVAVIQGNLEALVDGVYPPNEAHLGPVLEEVRLLSRLIDDLRTLSEAETGTLTLHREPTDLGVLAGELTTTFRRQADARQVEFRLDIDDELPLLEVDPVRIREVLVNLITNALRHTEAGGVVSILGAVADGYAHITVSDTGSGILPEDLPHIFKRFYRAERGSHTGRGRGSGDTEPASKADASHPTLSASGSGLGLTIAKDLVEAHGGTIEAESEYGRGTTLRVSLPLGAALR